MGISELVFGTDAAPSAFMAYVSSLEAGGIVVVDDAGRVLVLEEQQLVPFLQKNTRIDFKILCGGHA